MFPSKSPPSSPLAKENETEMYGCNDRLLQIPSHAYSQSSSSQSPSSLPSSRSVVSPQPLTPSSTDSHVSHEKSPSPHPDKVDLHEDPPKLSSLSTDSAGVDNGEVEHVNYNCSKDDQQPTLPNSSQSDIEKNGKEENAPGGDMTTETNNKPVDSSPLAVSFVRYLRW